MHATSYDEPICLPTEQSVLLSIRTQQIAQNDINITNVADPLGGSYYVEWLTNELENKAWKYLDEIETRGGLVACIESGWVHQQFSKAMNEQFKAMEKGEKNIVGLNCYKMDHEPYEIPIFYPDPESTGQVQKEKLERLKKERDNHRLEKNIDTLKKVTDKGQNVMPTVMEAVRNGATVGEICNAWRDMYGIWKIPFTG